MAEFTVKDWLESDYLRRVAQRVAYTYYLSSQDVPDLYQELCVALWKVGPERQVNATWVYHTAQHRALELLKGSKRSERIAAAAQRPGRNSAGFRDPELTSLLRVEAARLPASLRRFYLLRYEQGFTQREILEGNRLSRGLVRGMEKRFLRRMKGKRR